MAVFFWFCVGKRETVKSVVLLNEIDVLRGGRGGRLELFSVFLDVFGDLEGAWKLFGNYLLWDWI